MTTLSRRHLLAGAGATAAALALSACSADGEGAGGTAGNGGGEGGSSGTRAQAPNYVPFTEVTPDLPGDNALGIQPAFFSYPADPPRMREQPPAETDPIEFLCQGAPPPNPFGDSAWYGLLSSATANKFNFNWGSWTEYEQKFQVTIASGDLPELMMLPSTAPRKPQLLESAFTDLTPFLSGSAVEDYPGLASIPTETWTIPTLGSRIWGVTQPRPAVGRIIVGSPVTARTAGYEGDFSASSLDEWVSMCIECSDRSKNIFALGADPITSILNLTAMMAGSPNVWGEENGAFVHRYEHETFRPALEAVKRLWAEGALHPNSFSEPGSYGAWWNAGVTVFKHQSFEYMQSELMRPGLEAVIPELPGLDGGTSQIYLKRPGYGDFVAVSKQTSDDRVREILQFMDYFAAPFGTQEYLDVQYGVEGTHYSMESGAPIANKDATQQEALNARAYLGQQVNSQIYVPEDQSVAEELHQWQLDHQEQGVKAAHWELYSEWVSTNESAAGKDVSDVFRRWIQNEVSDQDLDRGIEKFVSDFADKAREEYAKAKENGGIA
ncbi:type 2 periplasmic-binding domain-containing protein [Parenemella sanctibonifatiensis]|uniref:Extracellular solute-binding protein n=1 Tax=Parenemella sanctibonifatiensis TaxID=2016505 RepID=A0A255ECB1_9ACTN|nr:extracellular solute-binding protein [Parenemella sanctibonifatiensis]OYN89187.1 hypothetical protein CGZ92_02995 [Parenemella sanctibonifatiensis]